MTFDPLVANPGRLRILTSLATEPAQAFVRLRMQTGLTDGNLATHAKRLQSAGLVAIDKSLVEGKVLTTLHLTAQGRQALSTHVRSLVAVLDGENQSDAESILAAGDHDDDWVD
jgi:DNA-binding MarR family transcriptional regulator